MRWNHPPNWPEPPAGWTPPSGWQPPADWPPAPAGWNFWVDDRPEEVNDDVWAAPHPITRPQPAPLLSAPRPPQKGFTSKDEARVTASGWLWLLALWPLIMGMLGVPVIAAMVASSQAYTAQVVIVILGNTLFGALDARDVRKAYGESPSVGWAAFLVPVYLWKRRVLTAQNQAPFIVWMVLFVLSLVGLGTFNNTTVIPATQPGTGISSNPVPDAGDGGGTSENKPMRVVWSGKGQGIKQTPSFPISGAWAVRYSYRDTAGYGCYFGIYGPGEFDVLANETGTRGSDTTFPTPVNGNVSLQINASCPWKVTVLN